MTTQSLDELIRRQTDPVPAGLVSEIKSETVFDQTGKPWSAWYHILDDMNVKQGGHEAVVKDLSQAYRLDGWWADVIVTRYEVVLGLIS